MAEVDSVSYSIGLAYIDRATVDCCFDDYESRFSSYTPRAPRLTYRLATSIPPLCGLLLLLLLLLLLT